MSALGLFLSSGTWWCRTQFWLFFREPHLEVLRGYSWLFTRELLRGGAQETRWDAKNQTRVNCVQGNCPTRHTVILAP